MKNWDTLDADVNLILTKHFTEGREGRRINKIVVHHNAGSFTAQQVYNIWQSREASAHYQVETSGRIAQLVWDSNTAWHTGLWEANLTSIGIEHANSSTSTSPLTAETIEAGAHLVAALCKHYGLGRPQWLVNVFPHQHFTSTQCPGHLATTQRGQYMTRAGYWYDMMTGAAVPEPEPTQEESMMYVLSCPARGIALAGPGHFAPCHDNDDVHAAIMLSKGNVLETGDPAVWDRWRRLLVGESMTAALTDKDIARMTEAVKGINASEVAERLKVVAS